MSGFLEKLQAQKRTEDAVAQRRLQEQSAAASANQAANNVKFKSSQRLIGPCKQPCSSICSSCCRDWV